MENMNKAELVLRNSQLNRELRDLKIEHKQKQDKREKSI